MSLVSKTLKQEANVFDDGKENNRQEISARDGQIDGSERLMS